ncbi:UDP-N-acetylmuramate dehydrogenase [Desulfurivibrio dismutans]|uniref:UDP-N-acetylmuramate dehydrogenase n=1 Tax=Desulfurivibrio dismutans TaxID=1398908 RepID=UPI0023DC3D18|nr:FAD-binding protein [Desulfurivibrio alkaliphilus]MDF1613431.1 FAD-binding protein [Desulfurivibrio alkaliphilus]
MAAAGCELLRRLPGDCLAAADRCPLFSENWSGALRRHEPLAPLTTFKVGGPAAITARPSDLRELTVLLAILQRQGCPWRVLGRGSNLLVADRGYAGVAIVLDRRLGKIELLPVTPAMGRPQENVYLVRVEAGCSLAALLNWTIRNGLGGLEFLAGIPGSIGGAVVMNAGAFGQSLGEKVVALELVSASGTRTAAPSRPGLRAAAVLGGKVPAEQMGPKLEISFTYRHLQGLAPFEVVGAAILAVEPKPAAEIKKNVRRHLGRRRAAQPGGVASAGSFFKNPPGDYAGRLIEAAGLKGRRVGRAEVSPAHANFLVNLGGARAEDLHALAVRVQDEVRRHSGVELKPEVHLLGFE